MRTMLRTAESDRPIGSPVERSTRRCRAALPGVEPCRSHSSTRKYATGARVTPPTAIASASEPLSVPAATRIPVTMALTIRTSITWASMRLPTPASS